MKEMGQEIMVDTLTKAINYQKKLQTDFKRNIKNCTLKHLSLKNLPKHRLLVGESLVEHEKLKKSIFEPMLDFALPEVTFASKAYNLKISKVQDTEAFEQQLALVSPFVQLQVQGLTNSNLPNLAHNNETQNEEKARKLLDQKIALTNYALKVGGYGYRLMMLNNDLDYGTHFKLVDQAVLGAVKMLNKNGDNIYKLPRSLANQIFAKRVLLFYNPEIKNGEIDYYLAMHDALQFKMYQRIDSKNSISIVDAANLFKKFEISYLTHPNHFSLITDHDYSEASIINLDTRYQNDVFYNNDLSVKVVIKHSNLCDELSKAMSKYANHTYRKYKIANVPMTAILRVSAEINQESHAFDDCYYLVFKISSYDKDDIKLPLPFKQHDIKIEDIPLPKQTQKPLEKQPVMPFSYNLTSLFSLIDITSQPQKIFYTKGKLQILCGNDKLTNLYTFDDEKRGE